MELPSHHVWATSETQKNQFLQFKQAANLTLKSNVNNITCICYSYSPFVTHNWNEMYYSCLGFTGYGNFVDISLRWTGASGVRSGEYPVRNVIFINYIAFLYAILIHPTRCSATIWSSGKIYEWLGFGIGRQGCNFCIIAMSNYKVRYVARCFLLCSV